jgi:hypothetical protein
VGSLSLLLYIKYSFVTYNKAHHSCSLMVLSGIVLFTSSIGGDGGLASWSISSTIILSVRSSRFNATGSLLMRHWSMYHNFSSPWAISRSTECSLASQMRSSRTIWPERENRCASQSLKGSSEVYISYSCRSDMQFHLSSSADSSTS